MSVSGEVGDAMDREVGSALTLRRLCGIFWETKNMSVSLKARYGIVGTARRES